MEMASKNTCVLRARYNISTADVPATATAAQNGNAAFPSQDIYLDATGTLNIYLVTPFDQTYISFPFSGGGSNNILSLAINTDQYGRTFQDRSYVFGVKVIPLLIPEMVRFYVY